MFSTRVTLQCCHFDLYFLPEIFVTSCVRLFLSFVPHCSVDAIHLDCHGWLEMQTRTCTESPKKKTHQIQEFPDSGGGLPLYSFQLMVQGCQSFLQENSLGHMKTFASKYRSCRQNFSRKYLGHQFKPAHRMETDVCWEMWAKYNWVLINIVWECYPENLLVIWNKGSVRKKHITKKYWLIFTHLNACKRSHWLTVWVGEYVVHFEFWYK